VLLQVLIDKVAHATLNQFQNEIYYT